MYQRTEVLGNLGNKVSLKKVKEQEVLNFSVAVNRSWKNKNTDEWEQVTTWYNCAVWGKYAPVVHGQIERAGGKGVVFVTGTLKEVQPNTFTRNDGTVGASYDLTVSEFRMASAGGSAGGSDTESDSDSGSSSSDEIPW
jgi:single-stranded DNA-binding protein